MFNFDTEDMVWFHDYGHDMVGIDCDEIACFRRGRDLAMKGQEDEYGTLIVLKSGYEVEVLEDQEEVITIINDEKTRQEKYAQSC